MFGTGCLNWKISTMNEVGIIVERDVIGWGGMLELSNPNPLKRGYNFEGFNWMISHNVYMLFFYKTLVEKNGIRIR